MSELDPRVSKVVSAHSLIVAALNVVHSVRTWGVRGTLLFAALGNAIPILGELLAVHLLKILRHHARPRLLVCPWPSSSAGTTLATEPWRW